MQKTTMEINLTLKGPLLTQSSNPGELGLDVVVARHDDAFKTPYLPGTLITGKLRQALEELQSIVREQDDGPDWFKPEINSWLGLTSKSDNLPLTKQLFFSDFDLEDLSLLNNGIIRDRIKIDSETEAVEKQQIAMLENPFTTGSHYTFTGMLHFFAPENQADNIIKHVKTAFKWFTQLGSMKSIGFGQVVSITFASATQEKISPASPNPATIPERIGLTFKPCYPFCLAKKPVPGGNLFESEPIIPGSAILGSIATTWNHLLGKNSSFIEQDHDPERKELSKNFSKLRITHVFPTSTGTRRPVVAPLSLVKIDSEKKLFDVALLNKPCLIQPESKSDKPLPPEPVAFSLDWKDDENTLKGYSWPYIRFRDWGWASLKTDMRVRTAINPKTGRSQENELFAYEQIIPEENNWHGELDLSRIEEDERPKVFEQLRTLLEHGVGGFSKTKTVAEISFDTGAGMAPCIAGTGAPQNGSQWVVTLQTDTLLGSPEELDETSGVAQLFNMYKKAWDELSGGSLLLIRHFARQKLSGGKHRWIVFQQKRQPYRPWLLTEAGSVFVLQATEDPTAAQEKIESWMRQGLPLTPGSLEYYRVGTECQWRTCPFIPQNGYGEIAVNLDTAGKTVILKDKSPQIISIDRVEE